MAVIEYLGRIREVSDQFEVAENIIPYKEMIQ